MSSHGMFVAFDGGVEVNDLVSLGKNHESRDIVIIPIKEEVMGISKSKIIIWCFAVVILIVGGFAGYVWTSLNWSFSKGERAGYVQKFSQKGWICKTWEGELQMIPVPGAIPEKFLFSVRNDAIAQKINGSMGRKVALHYEQHKGVPTTCFGETEYYVTDIRVIE